MSTAPTTPAATTGPEARERPGHGDGGTGARRRQRSRVLDRPGARAVVGLAAPAVLLLLWWAVTAAGLLSAVQLPSPGAVLSAGVNLLERGDLWLHVGISTQRVLLGFLLGAALGLAVGSALGLSRWADALFAPLIGALRAVPSLAWVPLLILWMQIGEESKVTLIAIGAFFPVFTTVYAALRHVDPHLVEAGRAFGYHGLSLLRTVQLPAVVPAVFSGLRLALAQAWLFLVAAELIASSMGLGFLLTDSQNNGRTDRLILAIILLAVLGKLTDWLLGLLERRALRRWA
ncbi:ABC transporter permease [Micrococcus luteus]|uniref:ABC transporter permease n=1 Tax=Micrococcus luteus TaxID=1270 RepID=UPI00200436DE|nr:ABC transporter permease [Micrococcus luteus]MCK6057667.1 ABC transporter permease [Micrococcus luteus]MCK6062287.1 ABC transporter permease [Micrococcus luteus]MCK6064520.1 ABC transporter permease [Micrococcus luteus]MCK6192894.1 ABC transporter permease [Micrococcus luteus]MCK6195026.1 ABC transporter permease [Micrococcus luteus]